MREARRTSGAACAAALALAAALAAATARAGAPSLEAELRGKAEAAVKAGTLGDFRQELVERLAKKLTEPETLAKNAQDLEILEHYLNVGRLLDFKGDEETGKFLVWFLGQREFCSRFLHALEPTDSPEKAVGVLRRLKAVKGVEEARYLEHSEMLIAFARVWDSYQWLPWTNLEVPDSRLEEIYEYYLTSGQALQIAPSRLPHELLIFVIDHPLPKDERDYALTFRGYENLGRLFYEIKWLRDETSLYEGHNKSVRYSLMNIKQRGGVCVEQAYYASTVAKCLGLPATHCRGVGARGGHAWVGVLRVQGRACRWDFNTGRYAYDHYWTGEILDPACRTGVLSDGEVAMTAGAYAPPRATLESADARRNLAVLILSGLADPGAATGGAGAAAGEQSRPGEVLPEMAPLAPARRKLAHDLLASSVQLDPCSRRSWQVIGAAAAKGVFTLGEIQAFSDRLFRSVEPYSPDFVCHTVQRFVAAIKDEAERDRLYEVCFGYFRKRPDLAAAIKVAQGRWREADGKNELALKCYLQAVTSFPQDGHVTQEAAKSIDDVLAKGEPKKAVEALVSVWRSMEAALSGGRPEERETMRLVGENLIKYLKLAGLDRERATFEANFRRMFPVRK